MQQSFKEAFTFNKAERRGIFILLLLAFLLLFYNVFGPFNIDFIAKDTNFEYQLGVFLTTKEKEELKKQTALLQKQIASKTRPKKRKINPHPFDPNVMTHKQWLELGLSEKQAKTIEKYKRKGGSFREPEDFRKIYCISEEEYEQLSPFIIINILEYEDEPMEDISFLLSINEVNIDEIQCVKGIGPAFAKRIVNYRKLLGGYTNLNQLYEVYGMDTIRYLQISPFFEINTDSIRRLSLKSSSYSQLIRHPYLSKDIAYEITNYRKMHGDFNKLEDLKKISIINDTLYQKIYLYFALD
ncbi:MAG: helix-hairpin-helix domain-containing protein [Bacteroidales bacterium]|nr:helix-hairpin-helix domain-containing protein [Bacteroidales bacterium]